MKTFSNVVARVPDRMKLVVDKDTGVSLSVIVEGFHGQCIDNQIMDNTPTDETPTWTVLSSADRICSQYTYGGRQSNICLVEQKRFPLRFSEDGIVNVELNSINYFDLRWADMDRIAINIVKEGTGIARLEKIYF